MKSKQIKGTVITLLAAVFWGFSGVCGQYLTQSKGLPVDFLTMIRMLSAGVILTVTSVIVDRGRFARLWSSPKGMVGCAIFGVFGVLLCQFTYLKAIYHSNAGTVRVARNIRTPFLKGGFSLILC